MRPKVATPPTPSPSTGRGEGESLFSTPASHFTPSQAPSSVSTVRATHVRQNSIEESVPIIKDKAAEFRQLHAGGKNNTRAFRVHSPITSPDSSLVWSGDSASSGFFPYNAHLALRPSVYIQQFGQMNVEHVGWELGPYVRHTMVDHINGKMRQGLLNIPSRIEERPGTPEDEKSPWISGTRSIMWAIWEVARRLAWDEDVVGLAVVKCGGQDVVKGEFVEDDKGDLTGMSELELWRKADEQRRRGYTGKELLTSPLRPIANALGTTRAGDMSVSMKEAYECALRAARGSEEILWYGRVLAESVEKNVEFSAKKLPIELPAQFWKRRSSSSSRRSDISLKSSTLGATPGGWARAQTDQLDPIDGWLSRLAWDPRSDEYDRAVQKIVARRMELCFSIGVTQNARPVTPI